MKSSRGKGLLKIILSVVFLAIAAALAFIALPNLYDSQSSTVNVVQLTGSIPSGTQIKESMLTTKQVGAYGIDGKVVTDKSDIVGKYSAYYLRGESILYADQFVDSFSDADGAADTLLESGEQLITVSIGAASSVGGMIKTGSIVDVYTQKLEDEDELVDEYGYSYDDDNLVEIELVPVLTNVRVYKVQNSALEDVTELQREWRTMKESNASDSDAGSSMIPAYVTLIVNKEQAETLALQQYNGVIHMVLSPDKTVASVLPSATAPTAPAAAEEQTPAEQTVSDASVPG